ncbi:MAG: serine/threonine protein kinase [Chloroflexi bacterium]|nr:MAG: serine/threonine protein kinase [Chloroflexota bacterium]
MNEQASNGDDLIGKTLGQFIILEEIGRGGMATVYKARQQSVNRIVAVKVLPRHFLHDPGFLERFSREVDVASHLEHPHILPIYDYGEAEGVPYIAMRYLGGGSMAQFIRRGVPEIDQLVKPFSQVAAALDYAHQQGIIHRDLKPGNIMLDENGNAYLSDFGIVHVLGSNLTGSMIVGTPAYMSPEQAHGLPIDSRSDIYSLGIVLFELLTGREPYQAETPMALLLKHINEPIPPLRQFRADIPEAVENVVAKATAKEPDERYISATEMAEAFAAAVNDNASRTKPAATKPIIPDDQPTIAAPTPPPTPAHIHPATEPLRPDTGQIPQPTGGSNRLGIFVLMGIVIIAAAAIVAVVVITSRPSAPTTTNNDPTPFPRAARIHTEDYSLTMPTIWMPELEEYRNLSDGIRLYHVWGDEEGTVEIAAALTEDMTIETYEERYGFTDYALIDTETFDNGVERRSYRIENDEEKQNGQIDLFFYAEDDNLFVLSFYTADSVATDSALLNRMQLILDSLRLHLDKPVNN